MSNVNFSGAVRIPATQKAQELAKRLLSFEVASGETRVPEAGIKFCACDKLRRPLSSLAGSIGFEALMYRALTLTKKQVPRLAHAKIGSDGCLGNLGEIEPQLSAEEVAEGEVVLIGNMVDLLFTFLGEALALRLIQDVWPDASFGDTDHGKDTEA